MAKTNDTRADSGAPEADEGKAAPARRSPSRKLVIMVVAGLVGLGAVGGGSYYFFSGGHGKAEVAAGAEAPPAKSVVFLDMPDVLVNLSSNTAGSERTQYLKVKVTLELPSETMSAQIQPLMPRLMDAFQTYLRELRPSDLDGSAGLYRLKEELTRRVNTAIAPGRINAVLFKEIVVQ
jgi:flagellar FliL protein